MGKSSVSDLSEHVFDLIQELFAIDPLLLVSVMPQLEFKLKVQQTHKHPHTHAYRHTRSNGTLTRAEREKIDISSRMVSYRKCLK